MGIVSMFYCIFYFFRIVLCAINFSHDKKSSWKHDCDNDHELEPVGLLKTGVLQALSSCENQTVLQCLKHHMKNCFTFNIFWEIKMESFGEATSKDTCFSLYLEKGKRFIQLFWSLGFTMVPKKNYFPYNFCYHEPKPGKKTSYELKAYKSTISGKLLLPGTVSFSTSYQWWLIRQMFLISASSLPAYASSPPWLPHQTAIFKIR